LGLQRPEVMTTVDMGGGLSVPTNSKVSIGAEEFSFPLEGVDSCLNTSLASDLSASEGAALSLMLPTRSRPVSSVPESSM